MGLLKLNLIFVVALLSSCAVLLLAGVLPGFLSNPALLAISVLVPVPVPTPTPTPTPIPSLTLSINQEQSPNTNLPRRFVLTFDSLLDSADISPDNTRLYVNDMLHNSVSVIDTIINEVTDILPVGNNPEFISIIPNGSKAYVANRKGNNVSVIDIETNLIKTTINFQEAIDPTLMTFTPDSKLAYIATLSKLDSSNLFSSVSIVDVESDTFIKTIIIGDRSIGCCDENGDPVDGDIITSIKSTPDGKKIFVTLNPIGRISSSNPLLGKVIVISTENNEFKRLTIGFNPINIEITKDGKKAYVINFGTVLESGPRGDGSITIIDVEKSFIEPENALIGSITREGMNPVVITLDPTRTRVYVGYSGEKDLIDKLIAIETEGEDNIVVGRLNLKDAIKDFEGVDFEDNNYNINIMPDGSKLYVSENKISTNFNGLIQSIRLDDTNFFVNDPKNIEVNHEIKSLGIAFEIPGTEKNTNLYAIHNDRISVINASTGLEPFKTIRTRGTGPNDVALSPDGSLLFAVNSGLNTVDIIDASKDEVIPPAVNVGNQPIKVAVTDDSKAYVLNFEDSTVSIIDGLKPLNDDLPIICNQFLSPVDINDPNKSGPIDVEITSEESDVYVICFSGSGSGQGALLNSNNEIFSTLDLASASVSIDIVNKLGLVYVVNGDDSQIRVFEKVGDSVSLIDQTQIPSSASDIAVSRNLISYVTTVAPIDSSITKNFVSIFDENLDLVTTLNVGMDPVDIEINSDDTKAYVVNSGDNTVSVINIDSNTIEGEPIPVGNNPIALEITPPTAVSEKVYVVNYFSNDVSIIDTLDNSVITIPVGKAPTDVLFTPDGEKAYVANSVSGTLSIINISDNTVIGEIDLNP